LGDRKGIWPVKELGVGFAGGDDLTGPTLKDHVIIITTIIISGIQSLSPF